MTTFAVDTSVLVAMASLTHPDHAAAAAELEARLGAGEHMIVPAHCLVECYSALTRMPVDRRFPAAEALGFVQSFANVAVVVALAGADYLTFLEASAASGVIGGRVYDALIAEAARLGNADVLLTFNLRHFASLPHAPNVRAPGS